MNKNLILIPYAFEEGFMSSSVKSSKKNQENYLQCVCVACVSAVRNGGESDVALVTNIEVPKKYHSILENNGVNIIKLEFDNFKFRTDKLWYLAFYKLTALYYVSHELEYDNYCYLDSDVYVQHSFSPIWKECSNSILLYDINHGYQVKDYQIIVDEFKHYFKSDKPITQYGGEFFAANKSNSIAFSDMCLKIFDKMNNENIDTTKGDEFILSIAGYKYKEKVKNASPYIYRFWTNKNYFYLISTNYKYNPICALHIPSEKHIGIPIIYKIIEKNNKLPSNEKVWKYFNLEYSFIIGIYRTIIKCINKFNW